MIKKDLVIQRMALPIVMLLGVTPCSHAGVLSDGPGGGKDSLSNLLVDATFGEWNQNQVNSVVDWINKVDPHLYGFNFLDGKNSYDYGLSMDGINQQLRTADLGGWDLKSIYGPKKNSRFEFTDDPDNPTKCSGGTLGGNDFPQNCLESIYPTETNAPDPFWDSLATVIQVTTISNTFNRPTSQVQRDIRRFAANTIKQGITGGGSAADNYVFDGRIGAYFSGGGSFGSLEAKPSTIPGQGRDGFNTYNQTGTGAVDFRFNDWAVAGFMFNYTGTQNDLVMNAGNLLADSYRFMPFASFIPFDNAYIDVMAGYGYQTYDSSRSAGAAGTYNANYSSDQALASIDLGYTVPIGAYEITGFAGGSYIGTNVSGYTESGSNVSVNPYNVSSWTSTVGTQMAYAISTSFGIVQPLVRAEWVHAYNTTQKIGIANPAGGIEFLPSVLGIADWGNITAGVQTILPQGMMAFLNYQGQVMNGGQNNGVLGGLRLEF